MRTQGSRVLHASAEVCGRGTDGLLRVSKVPAQVLTEHIRAANSRSCNTISSQSIYCKSNQLHCPLNHLSVGGRLQWAWTNLSRSTFEGQGEISLCLHVLALNFSIGGRDQASDRLSKQRGHFCLSGRPWKEEILPTWSSKLCT